jgi:hypothetical protein
MDQILDMNSELIKAAVAYCLDEDKPWALEEPNNFVWLCGGHDALCKIKASAVMKRSGNGVPPRLVTEQVEARFFFPLRC